MFLAAYRCGHVLPLTFHMFYFKSGSEERTQKNRRHPIAHWQTFHWRWVVSLASYRGRGAVSDSLYRSDFLLPSPVSRCRRPWVCDALPGPPVGGLRLQGQDLREQRPAAANPAPDQPRPRCEEELPGDHLQHGSGNLLRIFFRSQQQYACGSVEQHRLSVSRAWLVGLPKSPGSARVWRHLPDPEPGDVRLPRHSASGVENAADPHHRQRKLHHFQGSAGLREAHGYSQQCGRCCWQCCCDSSYMHYMVWRQQNWVKMPSVQHLQGLSWHEMEYAWSLCTYVRLYTCWPLH